MGLDENFPPMGFRDEAGNIVGFDVDLAKEAAKRMGMELVLQPIDWSAKEMELDTGRIDVIWNGFTMTEERRKAMEFTRPYLKNTQAICVAINSDIKTANDLAGKNVGTQAGSSAYELIETTPELKDSFKEVSTYQDYETALLDLEIGRVEAIIGDMVMLRYKISVQPDKFVLLDDFLADEVYSIGLKKGNVELRDKLQAALDSMYQDGTAAAISETWFDEDVVLKD
jgi:polar amino acid transport system substrate-binding protein